MRERATRRRALRWFSVLVAAATCGTVLPLQGAESAANIREFDSPSGLAIGGGHLWVTNEAGNSVTEINPSSGAWIATFNAATDGFRRPTAITSDGRVPLRRQHRRIGQRTACEQRRLRSKRLRGSLPLRQPRGDHRGREPDPRAQRRATQRRGSEHRVDHGDSRRNGSLVRTVSGPSFAFADPAAFAVSGGDVFVADRRNDAVTEVRVATGRLMRVVAGQGLSAPDGIAVVSGVAWVADSASNAVDRDRRGDRPGARHPDRRGSELRIREPVGGHRHRRIRLRGQSLRE